MDIYTYEVIVKAVYKVKVEAQDDDEAIDKALMDFDYGYCEPIGVDAECGRIRAHRFAPELIGGLK